jgi:hypothetical protein
MLFWGTVDSSQVQKVNIIAYTGQPLEILKLSSSTTSNAMKGRYKGT